jgi:hypothetical protein
MSTSVLDVYPNFLMIAPQGLVPPGVSLSRPTTQKLRQTIDARERRIDAELDQSFPASDPPIWVHGTTC